MDKDDLIRAARLTDPATFDARFNENIRENPTYQAAWEATEQEYESVFGRPKYASYDSYRLSRARRIRRKC